MNKLKLGWIGLGNMGNPMVMNLLKSGFEVLVYNRTKDKESPLLAVGAKSAISLLHLIETCDVVLTMLSNDDAVKEVFEGPTGLLSKRYPDKIIINMIITTNNSINVKPFFINILLWKNTHYECLIL